MELWNEYEGRSIDAAAAGLLPLEKLIRPEGRSAFFSTKNEAGNAAMIRLIESHLDEEDVLKRWNAVAELKQPNLLAFAEVGQTTMDDTPLVYALMEPAEADLDQILRERPLTVMETRQVASSLVSALKALHARGFIHENVKPVNVLAVGDIVKLRGDCIREAPEGAHGSNLRMRDVQDLAVLLLQCLTQQRTLEASIRFVGFPMIFKQIIHNGRNGSWGLSEIAEALESFDRPNVPAASIAPKASPPGREGKATRIGTPPLGERSVVAKIAGEASGKHASPNSFICPDRSEPSMASDPPVDSIAMQRTAEETALLAADAPLPLIRSTESQHFSHRQPEHADRLKFYLNSVGRQTRGWFVEWWGVPRKRMASLSVAALLPLLIGLVVWQLKGRARPIPSSEVAIATLTTSSAHAAIPAIQSSSADVPAQADHPAEAPRASRVGASRLRDVHQKRARMSSWRVVAYTFKGRGEALATSRELAHRHKSLHPEVFSPTKSPPFLVTYGGAMSHEAANAMKTRLLRSQAPGSLVVRNFKTR
jgi:hypothetical protein